MTRTSPPQVAFSSGELDPLLHRRFDYQRFQTGLAKCNGFLPLQQGGFTRAPGTIYRGRTKGDARCVLVPFEFAANDALILEFTPNVMRVWRYGALVMSGGVPYEMATPYDVTSLSSLRWVQSADVIYLVDGLRPMQRLSRFALDNWTIGEQVFDAGPFLVQNLDKDITLQASETTGTINLTSNVAKWTADHVGVLYRMERSTNSTVARWQPDQNTHVGEYRLYDGNTYEMILNARGDDNNENVPPTHTEGDDKVSAVDGPGIVWRFIDDGVGVVRIVSITSSTVAVAEVLKRLPIGCQADPTYRFAEGAWSIKSGWASAVELFDQRLVAAATPTEPRTVWFSTVGDFADFSPGVEADEAFAYTISGDASINRILHIRRGSSGLHIFALGEEYSTRSETRQQVIGPTTAVFSSDSEYGASTAPPIAPDGKPIFITRDRRRLIQIAYDFQQDGNQSRALSLPAQHLGTAFFEQIVWQNAPTRIGWLRRGSGDLVAMIYDPSEEILGWATVSVAGGFVDALAISPAADGSHDILTMAVLRKLNGETVRVIEQQALTFGVLNGAQPIAEGIHFFAVSEFSIEVAAAEFSVPQFANTSGIYAWTNEGQFGPFDVTGTGIVTLPVAVTQAVIGLFDDSHVVDTLDIQAAAQNGNTMGRQKRLNSVGLALHRTAQGSIEVIEREFARPDRIGKAQLMVPNSVGADLTTAFSGVYKLPLPSGHAKEVALRIRPVGGAPLTVTALIPDIQEAGS